MTASLRYRCACGQMARIGPCCLAKTVDRLSIHDTRSIGAGQANALPEIGLAAQRKGPNSGRNALNLCPRGEPETAAQALIKCSTPISPYAGRNELSIDGALA